MAQQKAPCPRCGGKGVIPQYFYNRKGICFLCWGSGSIMITVPAGKDKDSYIKELQASEMERFKKHPPKVPMPDKSQQRNKEYFKGAKPGVPAPEGDEKPKPDAKPNAKTGGGAPKPDAKPDPKPQGSEAQKSENVKQRNDAMKKQLASLGIDTDRNGGDMWKQAVDKFKTDGSFRSSFKTSQMAESIVSKDKEDGYRTSQYVAEAYVMAKLGEAVGKASGIPEDTRKQIAKLSKEKRAEVKKGLAANLEKLNNQTSNLIAGVIATGDSEDVDNVAASLVATLTAAKMLKEIDEVPYEAEKTAADYNEEIGKVFRETGFNKKPTAERTGEDYKKAMDGLRELKDNPIAKRQLEVLQKSYDKVAGLEQARAFRTKYGTEAYVNDPDLLKKALENVHEIEVEEAREFEIKRLKQMLERAESQSGERKAKAEADRLNKDLDARREEASKNRKFANTAIGQKIKEAVGSGLEDDVHARKVGKIAAREFEKNITKHSTVSYADYAKSVKKKQDLLKERASLKREIEKLRRMRSSVDAPTNADELIATLPAKVKRYDDSRLEYLEANADMEAKRAEIKKAKEKAYLETLASIRGTGEGVGMRVNHRLGNYEKITRDYIDGQLKYFPESWVEISNQDQIYIEKHHGRAAYKPETKYHHFQDKSKQDKIGYRPGGLMLSTMQPKTTVVHELAHRMEEVNPKLKEIMQQYYNRKTAGKESIWLGDPYEEREVYKQKKGKAWIDNYMGKDYGGRATEILSMGMESIVFDTRHVENKQLEFDDTETYETIWGVIAGA